MGLQAYDAVHHVHACTFELAGPRDVGVNGCNFAVAESGTCTIVSNEGNGRMASSIPKTQLIFLGTERIVPDFKALDVMMEMLNRSAVGSKISMRTCCSWSRKSSRPKEPSEIFTAALQTKADKSKTYMV